MASRNRAFSAHASLPVGHWCPGVLGFARCDGVWNALKATEQAVCFILHVERARSRAILPPLALRICLRCDAALLSYEKMVATGPVDAAKLFDRVKLLMQTPLDHPSDMEVHITAKKTFQSS